LREAVEPQTDMAVVAVRVDILIKQILLLPQALITSQLALAVQGVVMDLAVLILLFQQ
jgi:hypothetical protein